MSKRLKKSKNDKYEILLSNFLGNIENIEAFLKFHEEVLNIAREMCIFRKHFIRDKKKQKIFNKTISALRNPEKRSDLKPGYRELRKQAFISIVCYFDAFLRDFCTEFININYHQIEDNEIRIKWNDLKKGDFKFENIVGELYINCKGINFLDLKSIKRDFALLGIKIDGILTKTEEEDLVYYQNLRHIFIHKGGIVDNKFIDVLKGIKRYVNIKEGEKIIINYNDIYHAKKITEKFAKKLKKLML